VKSLLLFLSYHYQSGTLIWTAADVNLSIYLSILCQLVSRNYRSTGRYVTDRREEKERYMSRTVENTYIELIVRKTNERKEMLSTSQNKNVIAILIKDKRRQISCRKRRNNFSALLPINFMVYVVDRICTDVLDHLLSLSIVSIERLEEETISCRLSCFVVSIFDYRFVSII
jgi:hypothetical protein